MFAEGGSLHEHKYVGLFWERSPEVRLWTDASADTNEHCVLISIEKGLGTDIEQVKKMVDLFMDAGFTYFDTAFVYTGSEAAIKKALVDRYPRQSYTLATKLNAFMMAPTEKISSIPA